jgi:hypothetical protein
MTVSFIILGTILICNFTVKYIFYCRVQRNPLDAWVHIHLAGLLRKYGSMPDIDDSIFPPQELGYPWGIAKIITAADIRDPLAVWPIFNLLLESLEAILVVAVMWFLGLEYLELSGIQVFFSSLAAMGIYVLSPYSFNPRSGMNGVNARPLGSFLCNVSLLGLCLGQFGYELGYAFMILAFPVILFTSCFAHQALLIGTFALAICTTSLVPIAVYITSLLLAVIVLRKAAIKIIKRQFSHLDFYARYVQFHHIATTQKCLSLTRWLFESIRNRSIAFTMRSVLNTPFLRLFLLLPWAVFAPLAFWFDMPGPLFPLAVLAGIGIAIVPFITIRCFRFLGEADRYMFFLGRFPLAIVTGWVVGQSTYGGYLWIMLAVASLACLIYIITRLPHKITMFTKANHLDEDVAEFINSTTEDGKRVIFVPTNLNSIFVTLLRPALVGTLCGLPKNKRSRELLRKLYPSWVFFPTSDFEILKKDFSVQYIVYSRHHIDPNYLTFRNIDLQFTYPKGNAVYENARYLLFKLE